MHKKIMLIGLIFVFLFTNFSLAQEEEFTHVISNSEDWRDVYSIMQYGRFSNAGADFLASTRHGPLLLNEISKQNNIRVVSSASVPYSIGYDDIIRDNGFAGADELIVDNANLELIEELPEINNFIIVGNTYGYNAIAVAPYAAINNAWVFFADRTNIDEIDSILSSRQIDEILIYGYVEREVRETLAKYNPEIINEGDRFSDDIAITEKYLEINPVKQVLLSNGEFIEKELISGSGPVLFTGKQNVPEQIANYIKSSDIEVAVLVGSDLVGTATNIRRSTGISVIVKFARGARNPGGSIAAVEGLDLFYLPIPTMQLGIYSAKYNRASSQLELTYKSDSNVPVYFKGTITPVTSAGERTRIGDAVPIFIAPNDFKTISYPDVDVTEESFSIDLFTIYGESPGSLERAIEGRFEVENVNVIDNCQIRIAEAVYSKPKESFLVEIENTGETDCWVDVELIDIFSDNDKITIGSEGSSEIKVGKSEKIEVEREMTDEDLESNKFVDVIAYFGEREDSLVRSLKARLELKIQTISMATIGISFLILILAIALIIALFYWRKRKDEII